MGCESSPSAPSSSLLELPAGRSSVEVTSSVPGLWQVEMNHSHWKISYVGMSPDSAKEQNHRITEL